MDCTKCRLYSDACSLLTNYAGYYFVLCHSFFMLPLTLLTYLGAGGLPKGGRDVARMRSMLRICAKMREWKLRIENPLCILGNSIVGVSG